MEFDNRVYNFEHVFFETMLPLEIGNVFQIAEVSLEKGTEFSTHLQGCDEITFCVSGKAFMKVNGKLNAIAEGQVHYIKTGVNHGIAVDEDKNFRYICVGFVPNSSHPLIKEFQKAVESVESFVVDDNGYIKRLSELLIRELYLNDNHSNEMTNSFISQIITALIRILNSNDSLPVSQKSKKNSSYTIYKILRYIDREYLTITSIHSLAEALNYSESYLSHVFVQKVGVTLKEYITRKKIEHSIELLKQCDLTVDNISELLNFSSTRVFRRTFKQYTGYSPVYFRDK